MRNRLLCQIASVYFGALTGTLTLHILDVLRPQVESATIDVLTVILIFLTAVGAIWAALAATAQSRAATRQAQAAEEGITQQARSAQEQAERQRLALKVDLILRLLTYFESEAFLETRRRTGKYIEERYFLGEDDLISVERINNAATQVLNFMELLGYLVRNEAIDAQALWERFGVFVVMYWALFKPAIENTRELREAPWSWEDFEFLHGRMVELFDQRGGISPRIPTRDLRTFAQLEATIGTDEEPPDPLAFFRSPQQPF